MSRAILSIILMAVIHSVAAQSSVVWDIIVNKSKGKKVSEIQHMLDNHFKGRDKGKGSGWRHYQRWLDFVKDRTDSAGYLINVAAKTYDALVNPTTSERNETMRLGGNWFPLTMSSVSTGRSGRVNCIAFHPTNTNIIFAGTPAGGLWKTTDGGITWSCISIGIAFLGVSGIAIDPGNPNIIYILTGDGDGWNLPSIGVLKSFDGGLNWFETGLKFDGSTNIRAFELKMAPGNPNLLLAACGNGLYRTTNGGITWTQFISGGLVYDVEFSPNDADICYAASGMDVYVSNTGGATWTSVPSSAYIPEKPLFIGGLGRTELAVTAADPGYLYVLFASAEGYLGLYRSTDFGVNYTRRSNTPDVISYAATGGGGNQYNFDLALTVSPVNASVVYVGGINIWKSSNGGATWGDIAVGWYYGPDSKFVHADIHALEARNSNDVWVGTDGGVFRTTNGGVDWTSPSTNLNALQFYAVDGTSADFNLFYGGTQDNGSMKYTPGTYEQVGCCDAGEAIIDYGNVNNVFINASGSFLYRSTTGFPPTHPSTFADVTPWVGCGCRDTTGTGLLRALKMNPANRNSVFAVYKDCYKTYNNGASWVQYATGSFNMHNTIAISPSDTGIVYIATLDTIRKSMSGGATWNMINKPTGIERISQIAVDPVNPNRIWISCNGFTSNQKVYEGLKISGSDHNYAWINRSSGLPNVPINCILVQNTPRFGVYVGTDIGVYLYTIEGWTPYMNGLPNVQVNDLYLDASNGILTAATFGMGLWQSSIYDGCTPFVNHGPGFLVTPIYGAEYFEASDSIRASRILTGGAGTSITYNSGGYVRMIPGFEVRAGTTMHAYIEGCTPGFAPSGKKGEVKKSDE